jgi:exonuclease SbcC
MNEGTWLLRAQNFQSWLDSGWVELAPAGQLTVFTGPSDSGKTALAVRLFKWIGYGEPQGDGFIRVGANMAVGSIKAGETLIVRKRSRGGINRYELTAPDGQTQVFEGFGSTVPLEIRQALGITETKLEGLAEPIRPNLAEQLDGPFLGRSIPATGRAKVLGYLSGTDAVDAANKSTGTDLYRANREVESLEAKLKTNAEQQAGLSWVEPLGLVLGKATEIQGRVTQADERRGKLANLKMRYDQNTDTATGVSRTLARLVCVPQAEVVLSRITDAADRLLKISTLADRYRANSEQSARTTAELARLAMAPRAEVVLAELSANHARRQATGALLARYKENETLTARTQAEIDRLAGVPAAADKLTDILAAIDRLAKLQALWQRYRTLAEQGKIVQNVLDKKADIEAAESRLAVVAKALETRGKLLDLSGRMTRNAQESETNRLTLVRVENEHTDLVDALTESGICWTCGSHVDPKILKEAV